MDPSDIENTDDWLGCPTQLETCRHQLALYENEFEELNLHLQQSRERIFKLGEMHAAAAAECETLRSQLSVAKSETSEASRRATDIETKSNWELMAKDKHIAELRAQIRILSGDSPFKYPFPHQRDTESFTDAPGWPGALGNQPRGTPAWNQSSIAEHGSAISAVGLLAENFSFCF